MGKNNLPDTPFSEVLQDFLLSSFPNIANYKFPLKSPKKAQFPSENLISEETAFKSLFCAAIHRLITSDDYMDDEKKGILEWLKQQPAEKILEIIRLHLTQSDSIEIISPESSTEQKTEILDNIVTQFWQIEHLESMALPDRLRILLQLLVEGMLIHNKSLTKEVDYLQIMISKMTSKKLLDIVNKYIPDNPYQFLLHACYDVKTTEEDGITCKRIVSGFVTHWLNLSEEKREEIKSKSKIT